MACESTHQGECKAKVPQPTNASSMCCEPVHVSDLPFPPTVCVPLSFRSLGPTAIGRILYRVHVLVLLIKVTV